MKWALRNKTAEKRLKMAIFKLLALSYMHTTLYILNKKRNATIGHRGFLSLRVKR